MSKLMVTRRNGGVEEIEGAAGRSVMEIMRGAGIDEIAAICGGMLSCATCHVYVTEGWESRLAAQSADEDELLDGSSHRRPDSRLSCQIVFTDELDGLRVTIAPEG